MRKQLPREVCEDPGVYEFHSVNFELLNALFDQIHENNHDEFIAGLLHLVEHGGNTATYPQYFFPKFEGVISDLPLITEFAIRNRILRSFSPPWGAQNSLPMGWYSCCSSSKKSSHFNFNIFSEAEYNLFPAWLGGIRQVADLQTHKARGNRGGKMVENPHYKPGRERVSEQMVKSVDNLFRQIQQAEYYYLKGALQQNPNLEVENDKVKIQTFIDTLGFDPLLSAALKKADDIYNANPDAFDLKSCMGHIRSFIEHLHIDAGQAIAKSINKAVVARWNETLTFLTTNNFLTSQQEKLARGLHALVSDEGVHPLIAGREFARLSRNMAIEYGLMFLTVFEKKGIKIQATMAQTTTGTSAGSPP